MIRMEQPEGFGSKGNGNERVSPEIEQKRKQIEIVLGHLENIRGRLSGIIDEAASVFFTEESLFLDSLLDMLDHIDQSQGISGEILLDHPADMEGKLGVIDRWLEVLIGNADFLLGGDNITPGIPALPGMKDRLKEAKEHPLWKTSWLPAITEIRRLAQVAMERKTDNGK